ncbi:Nitroreductase-like protein [Xylariaceae sp. FL0016]|nr:Nitroreductase-like protein [Xylariaceae sp. FL0016]
MADTAPSHTRTDSGLGLETQKPNGIVQDQDRRSSVHMLLDEAILSRHSTRLYLPKPVPRELLNACLELATHAPSNSNTQAWRVYIVQDTALDRLKGALTTVASSGAAPNIPGLPDTFRHYRSELGKQVYGEGWQIPREDKRVAQESRPAQL